MITLTYFQFVFWFLTAFGMGGLLGYFLACLMATAAHEDDMRGTR